MKFTRNIRSLLFQRDFYKNSFVFNRIEIDIERVERNAF